MIDTNLVNEMLGGRRLAVVGASDDRGSFGGTIYRAMRDHGHEVVPVNAHGGHVAGDPCYPDLASVPAPVDGVIVMVGQASALGVVRECARLGIGRVWLFQGLGGPGAVSDEAIRICEQAGIQVVAGACPLMFLEPVGWFHTLHRGMRYLNGSLSRAS